MTTQEKIKAVQSGRALIENDGSKEQLIKAVTACFFNCDEPFGGSPKYYGVDNCNPLEWNAYTVNPYNLPTIPASTFFQDESYYNPLFQYLHEEHDLTLLDSELQDVINVVNGLKKVKTFTIEEIEEVVNKVVKDNAAMFASTNIYEWTFDKFLNLLKSEV